MSINEFNSILNLFNNEFDKPVFTGKRKELLYSKVYKISKDKFKNALANCLLTKYNQTTLRDIFTQLLV